MAKQVLKEKVLVFPGLDEFAVTMQRVFSTRRVEIIAPETAEVSIPGRANAVTGIEITAENIANPQKLDIKIEADKGDLQAQNEETLFLKKGTIVVTGLKKFRPEEQLKARKELARIPEPVRTRDPDLLTVDGREFRQVGTIRVVVSSGAMIRL
jgi:hypothetical protein